MEQLWPLLDDTADRTQALIFLLLLALRVLPVAFLLPALRPSAPSRVLSLAIGSAGVLALAPLAHASLQPGYTPVLMLAAAAELVRGVVFALALVLPLHAFGWTGELFDRVGVSAGSTGITNGSLPLRALLLSAAFALYFASGSHELALATLADSLVSSPIGTPLAHDALGPALLSAAFLITQAFTLAVTLAAPLLVCMALAALGLGLLHRVAGFLAPAARLAGYPLLSLAVASLVLARVLPALPQVAHVLLFEAARVLRTLG